MNDNDENTTGKPARRPPWNKGKLVGPKPPLRPSHVWSIRTKLQLEGKTRGQVFTLEWRSFLETWVLPLRRDRTYSHWLWMASSDFPPFAAVHANREGLRGRGPSRRWME